MLEVKSLVPEYGVNYKPGYLGFTFEDNSLVSNGIAYFTRWERLSQIKVSHVFIVSCKNECIEAQLENNVVDVASLIERFEDPHCHMFFRKPVGLTSDVGSKIVYTAASQVGCKYDQSLILAQALDGTFVGRAARKLFGEKLDNLYEKIFDHADRWICSELAAYCLDEQPDYRDVGCLSKPNALVSPQELFEDEDLFQHWKRGE